ncbi:MAG: hypothetical protein K1X92_07530 [Bacteroidia bacterium]|nr:hypothetical protein [Bacteroidia bacterium]
MNLGEVVKKYLLQYRQKVKLEQTGERLVCPASLSEDIGFILQEVAYDTTLYSICENLVYPVLKESWKPFSNNLSFWGHIKLNILEDENDKSANYLFSKRSELGKIGMEVPFLVLAEVSLENPKSRMGVVLEKMHKIQQLNEGLNYTIYGIITNGETWEFAKLEKNIFTQYVQRLDIGDSEKLYAGITTLLSLANRQMSTESKIFPLEIQVKSAQNPSVNIS